MAGDDALKPQTGAGSARAEPDRTQNTVILLSLVWTLVSAALWIWTPLLFLWAAVTSLFGVVLVATPVLWIRSRIRRRRLLALRAAQLVAHRERDRLTEQ